MPQTSAWEKEYQKPQLVTKNAEPQSDVKEYLRFLRKKEGIELVGLHILDLGSGTGRNANFLAELGNTVSGIEISKTAVQIAKQRAGELGVNTRADYHLQSMGEKYPFEDEAFDVAIDITSSNSLNEKERKMYLAETSRVLRPQGHLFVRALCKDGDQNAKNLLKMNPGAEYDTYINKDMGLTERVFSEKDFKETYGAYFDILSLEKKTNYARFKGQSYKRNYWLGYLKKK